MRRDLLNFCKKRVRERAQLNRIDPYRIKLPKPEDRKDRFYIVIYYTVIIIFCPTVFGLVAELHQKCILFTEFYKCRNVDAKSHTYTSIPQLSSPFSLMLTIFLPLPRAFLSLSRILFFSFSYFLFFLQRVRLNTLIRVDKN